MDGNIQKKRMIISAIILLLAATIVIGLIFGLIERSKPRTYEEKVEAFAQENATLMQGQIVFIGDSMTARYKLNRYYGDLELAVYNRGISGDTATWLQTRLHTSLLELAPSKIVLMIGTNDINYGKSAQEIANDYENLLRLIRQDLPNAEIFCVSIIPQNTDYSQDALSNNARICESNEKIKALANSYKFEYIDLYGLLVDESGLLNGKYSADGLHLNNKGYAVWTGVIKERLR